jgi:adenylyltransferase/sulfurtransferase
VAFRPNEEPLNESALTAIYTHAERAYPEECCGLVLSDGTVRPCANALGQAGAAPLGPSARSARDGYTLSFDDTVFLQRSLDSDRPTRIVYHSHPDAGAHFSAEDRERALLGDEPIYPVSHLVVEVRCGQAMAAKLYEHADGDFRCAAAFDNRGRSESSPSEP